MANDVTKAWYALQTKPRAERRVFQTLEERGFETFLPMLPATARQPSRPLFPTYLFARWAPGSVESSGLRWIPGLQQILAFDGQPATVPELAIQLIQNKLRQIEDAGGISPHPFKPGDEVVVEEGPLAGLRGIFQGPVGPAERVRILLQFLGHANRAEVPAEILRPVSSDVPHREHRRGTRGRGRRVHYHQA